MHTGIAPEFLEISIALGVQPIGEFKIG